MLGIPVIACNVGDVSTIIQDIKNRVFSAVKRVF
jgi:hypothetical protein